MLGEIESVLEKHRPDEVAIYFVFPTGEYLARHFGGSSERFQEFIRPFEEQAPTALREIGERLDYALVDAGKHVIRLGNRRARARKSQRGNGSSYCDVPSQVHRPLNLLGLGDSARSRIFGKLIYRAEHDHDRTDPDLARYVGFETSLEEEIFDYVAHVFRDGDRLSRPLFRRTCGEDITDVYRRPLAKLCELGVVSVEPEEVVFQPQSRQDRMRDLMFFLPPERRRRISELGDWRVVPASGAAAPKRVPAADLERAIAPLSVGAELAAGFVVNAVQPPGIVLRRESPSSQVLVKLLEPAGSHPSCRQSGRFDLQYEVQEGQPEGPDFDAALDALTAILLRNEAAADS
jgi:hypothetical protein